MTELIEVLKERARKELRYMRGMQTMHRERYIEYCRDLRQAQKRGDHVRARQIIEDLAAFTGEMRHLIEQRRGVYERLVALQSDERYDGPEPANG